MELQRGRISFGLDRDLRFDLAFFRHYRRITAALREFKPDLLHITGPNDVGIAGVVAAHDLSIPLAASWHTNVHEYAARRAATLVPAGIGRREVITRQVQDASFAITARYFRIARWLYAPNQELIDQLGAATGKPCFLMARGVDSSAFSPRHRDRKDSAKIVVGYVGRLTAEKSVREFAELGRALQAVGVANFEIVFVGQGSEQSWLQENVPNAVTAGVLKGSELSRAYANFDIFAFPSQTDTFGNVVLEALASGVPAVVTSGGGPKFIVHDGKTGFVASDRNTFSASLVRLATDRGLRAQMGAAAREAACRQSWDSVFDSVYESYATQLERTPANVNRKQIPGRLLA
jgi:glycosyltransferase involved in cell wall biosynthesis